MQIDVSHRSNLVIYDKAAYIELADGCVSALSDIRGVSSIVVCGSLAKGDLVPGWSDLDIIVFVSDDESDLRLLEEIKQAIESAQDNIHIGIGLDIVYEDQFIRSHKLCGRPYMMTYEVAIYGQLRYGDNPLRNVLYDIDAEAKVNSERYQLIAAEVHSWRRAYVSQKYTEQNRINWLFTCAKALLRILQCETGPNLIAPINSSGALNRFIRDNPNHPAVSSFVASVDIRRDWSQFYEDGSNIEQLSHTLAKTLNSYPLALPEVNRYQIHDLSATS
jgi:predicted nucleotidyltransferase